MNNYMGRDDLLALDLDESVVDRLLRDTRHSGHDGRPVLDADRLDDLVAMLDREGRGER
jgi:hypothetical protein